MGWGAAFFTSATAVCFAVMSILFVCGTLWAVLGWKKRSGQGAPNASALLTLRIVIGGGCLVLCLCFAWLSFTYTWFNYNLAHAAALRYAVEHAAAASTPFSVEPDAAQSAR